MRELLHFAASKRSSGYIFSRRNVKLSLSWHQRMLGLSQRARFWNRSPSAHGSYGQASGSLQWKGGLPSLRFRLRRSHDHRLVVFKRASTEILRARQRFLREFGLPELPIGQIQLIMDIAVMVYRSRLLEFRDGIGKLS